MKKTLYFTGIVLWGAVAFTACEKVDVDREKPVITVMKPAEDEVVTPGSAIRFEVEFSDNEALASYKVNIHGAFDGHEHNAAVKAAGRNEVVAAADYETGLRPFGMRAATDSVAFEKTWAESDFIALGATPIAGGKKVTVAHQYIVIPENLNGKPLREGHYHFIVYCTDQSGQESFVSHEIFISY